MTCGHPAVRRQSNLNFLFRLSLKFYRLVSSSVARGSIPERSEASRRLHGLHGLAEIKQWNRSRTGNCGNEPSGDRPDGSFYCWAALAGARRSIRSQDPLRPHGDVDRNARTLSSWMPLHGAMKIRLSDLKPRFTCNAAVNSPRAELLTIRILIATEHGSIQALTEFHFRFGANR
jgi:hypothetical protein